MSKARIATVWLDGCSGCHMSFLDIDELLIDLAEKADIVYSPLVDHKEFPPDVDVTLVEGAVSSMEDWEKIRTIRQRTNILVSMGDCAVTGNVPSMRNQFSVNAVMERAYIENVTTNPHFPHDIIPTLLARVRPVHEVVAVDVFVPGCPPSASALFSVVSELLEGRIPKPEKLTGFGQ